MTLSQEQMQNLSRTTVYDSSGDKVGTVGAVYADDRTGEPTWATVNTGLFGMNESFVPVQGARLDGDRLVVDYGKQQIKDAPNIDQDGHLSPEEEQALFRHYGLDYGTDEPVGTVGGVAEGREMARGGTVGYDTSGPTTDDAMTLSEERLRVGTERVETGRARLRKYVVTEDVAQAVPVAHEEVRVEREPITEANRDAAYAGAEISEEEHEVVLHAERPVVAKETVAVERVRLATETVRGEEQVRDQVRKEQVDTDGVQTTGGVAEERVAGERVTGERAGERVAGERAGERVVDEDYR